MTSQSQYTNEDNQPTRTLITGPFPACHSDLHRAWLFFFSDLLSGWEQLFVFSPLIFFEKQKDAQGKWHDLPVEPTG
jgi:hypothetical protein